MEAMEREKQEQTRRRLYALARTCSTVSTQCAPATPLPKEAPTVMIRSAWGPFGQSPRLRSYAAALATGPSKPSSPRRTPPAPELAGGG